MEQPSKVIRINIDPEELQRRFPPAVPNRLAEGLREFGNAAAPAIQKSIGVIVRAGR